MSAMMPPSSPSSIIDLQREKAAPVKRDVPHSPDDTNLSLRRTTPKTADTASRTPPQTQVKKENPPQHPLEPSTETGQCACPTAYSFMYSSPTSTPTIPREYSCETHRREPPVVSPHRYLQEATEASGEVANGKKSDIRSPNPLYLDDIRLHTTTKASPVIPSNGEPAPFINEGKPASVSSSHSAKSTSSVCVGASDRCIPPLSPRQRSAVPRISRSESPADLFSTCFPAMGDGGVKNAAHSTEKPSDAVHITPSSKDGEKDSQGPKKVVSLRGIGSETTSDAATSTQSRLAIASSCPSTPQSLVQSATSFARALSTDGAKSADATLTAELKELHRALKEKERDIARLTRNVERVSRSLAKSDQKVEELQGKLNNEKSLLATHKKNHLEEKQALQKELRQCHSTLRTAEQAQEKLQRELEKQKEKLASSSRSTNTAATPPVTSSDATVQPTIVATQDEVHSLKQTIRQLEEQLAAAHTPANLLMPTEPQRDAVAVTESAKRMDALNNKVHHLQQLLCSNEATRHDQEKQISTLTKENETLRALGSLEKNSGRNYATQPKLQSTSAAGGEETEGQSPSLQSPRPAMTGNIDAKENTAHQRDALRVIQGHLGTYKLMSERAERRAVQLEAELTEAQRRAKDAEEKCAKMTSDAVDPLRLQVDTITRERDELRQCVQERSEESTTLQLALQETEDERDGQVRQTLDLQSRVAEAEKKLATTLATSKAELQVAADRTQQCRDEADALRRELTDHKQRCAQLEEERQVLMAEREEKAAAAEQYKQQADFYQKKCKEAQLKLADATREVAVLQTKCESLSESHEATEPPSSRKNSHPPIVSDKNTFLHLPTSATRHSTVEDIKVMHYPASSSEVEYRDGVSRNLSAALFSAHKLATSGETAHTREPTAGQEQEQHDLERLHRSVPSLYTTVPCIAPLRRENQSTVKEKTYVPINDVLSPIASPSLRGYDQRGGAQQRSRMPACMLQQPGTSPSPARGRSPGRARSPGAAHVLNDRYFDPTMFSGCEADPSLVGVDGDEIACTHRYTAGPSLASRSAQPSPPLRSKDDVQSPDKTTSPRSRKRSTSDTDPQAFGGGSVLTCASRISDIPCTSRHYSSCDTSSIDRGTGQRTGVELQFSCTAGRLLLSKRRQRVERPVFFPATNESHVMDVCCAALGTISHRIHFSLMSAAGKHHLKNAFRFTIRILCDCANGDGDILVGFADRHVPMESFGEKQNALHYNGCHYLSLREGRLFCPTQNIRSAAYPGWRAAATEALARRSSSGAGLARESYDMGTVAQQEQWSPTDAPQTSTPVTTEGPSRSECIVRAGDEISCTLRMDKRSISYSWNGVECGVAFTRVALSPSLYPCVEVNAAGGAVELI